MEKTASDLLTVHAAAEALSVSERTVRSWIASGWSRSYSRPGSIAIRIDKADLRRSELREVER
jgi:excisionase family DNA binding protein